MTTKKATPDQSLEGEGVVNPDATAGAPHIAGLTAAAPGGIVLAKKQSVLDWIFGNTALTATADTNYYVGLVTGTYTGGTSDIAILQGTFTGTPEVVSGTAAGQWNGYAAVAVANTAAQWTAASGVAGTQVATKTNTNAISFTANATITTAPGPVPTGWFIANSATLRAATNIIATGNLTAGSTAVVNGAAVSFAAASLSILLT